MPPKNCPDNECKILGNYTCSYDNSKFVCVGKLDNPDMYDCSDGVMAYDPFRFCLYVNNKKNISIVCNADDAEHFISLLDLIIDHSNDTLWYGFIY